MAPATHLDATPPLTTSTTPSSSSAPTEPATPASPICTKSHAIYCFDVLSAHFEGREPMSPPFENPDEPFALFVTWNTVSKLRPNKKPALRGCIGNFTPMPLAKGLREYALISALKDHRFSPITKSELPNLQCSISLLTPFTPIPHPLDWKIGQHGIHITFSPPSPTATSSTSTAGRNRALSATYLPEVCADQGWTKEEAVLSAIQKAGYRGRVKVGDEIWESLKVKRYGSVKASAEYAEYEAWKQSEGGDYES